MSKKTKRSVKIWALSASFVLAAAAFAPLAQAQESRDDIQARIQALRTQLATLQARLANAPASSRACVAWNRDFRIGSSGPEVKTLQEFLISKGISINAGATGYFGGQTQAALARYQASVGITPAAGYFGPVTRARIAAMCADNPAVGRDDDREDEDEDEDEDRDEDSNDRDDDDNDEDEDDTTSTSARVSSVDGADNDYATFTVETRLRAFGDDMYIPRSGTTAFTYQIENASTGEVIGSATATSSTVSSSADTEGSSYVINENDSEEFTFKVVFDPLAADEEESYRFQLLTVVYGNEEGDTDESWTARPTQNFETSPVYIAD